MDRGPSLSEDATDRRTTILEGSGNQADALSRGVPRLERMQAASRRKATPRGGLGADDYRLGFGHFYCIFGGERESGEKDD